MNRWTLTGFVALAVALGGAWWNMRTSGEPTPSQVIVSELEATPVASARPLVEARPTPEPVPVPPSPSPPSVPAVADAGLAGGYDDSHLYRVTASGPPLPATAQGVLLAFERANRDVAACHRTARAANPALTYLMSVEVRVAPQEDGSAAIEEIRLPASNDPALAFRGCLIAALVEHRFEVPPGGSTRITLPVDLSPRLP